MPITRSGSNAKKSPSARGRGEGSGSRLLDVGDPNDDLQVHLTALKNGIQNLKKAQEDLLSKNGRLQQEIDRWDNEVDVPIQPKKSNSLLSMKVKELELEVRQLKKARAQDRKKIRQLRLKEAHQDFEELQDERLHGVPNLEHIMKKLLQRFHRVVSSPSLGEEEECPICADTLELNTCSSLPCQHIFCDTCLTKLNDGEDIKCPQCRRPSDIESLEQVELTAMQQWDQLLEIAQQFAAIEVQLGPDTSEEEILREDFIDDSEASTSKEHDTMSDAIQEDVSSEDGRDDSQPGHVPYSQSGVVEKRKRMNRLVAQREHKRLRGRGQHVMVTRTRDRITKREI